MLAPSRMQGCSPDRDLGLSPPAGPHEKASEPLEHPGTVAAAGPCCPLVLCSTPGPALHPTASWHSSSVPSLSFNPKTSTVWHHLEQIPLPSSDYRVHLPAALWGGGVGEVLHPGWGGHNLQLPQPHPGPWSPSLADTSPGSGDARFPLAGGTIPNEGAKPGAPEYLGYRALSQNTAQNTPPGLGRAGGAVCKVPRCC